MTKTLHAPFSLARRLVGVFSPMVQGAVPPVFDAWQDLPLGGSVTFQLIGDDDPWNVLASFEALAEEFLHGRLISLALDENIQHMAVLIHGAPEVMPLTVDRQKHLVEVPLVVRR